MLESLEYGAGFESPQQACAVLRALGGKNGIEVTPASNVDLAAAAYAAQQWCLAFDTTTLAYPKVHGDKAVKTLSAILSRACGHRSEYTVEVASQPNDPVWFKLTAHLPYQDALDAYGRVVVDLTYGNSEVLEELVMQQLVGSSKPEA